MSRKPVLKVAFTKPPTSFSDQIRLLQQRGLVTVSYTHLTLSPMATDQSAKSAYPTTPAHACIVLKAASWMTKKAILYWLVAL